MTAKQKQVLLVISAVLVALTAVMRAWFSAPGVDAGLWGVDVLGHGTRWDNVPGAQDDMYLAGYLACAAALVGAAATLVFVATGSAAKLARITLTVALAGMAYFVLRGYALDGLSNGIGLGWATFVGPIATVTARQLLPKS